MEKEESGKTLEELMRNAAYWAMPRTELSQLAGSL
jgi:hypothetical protein